MDSLNFNSVETLQNLSARAAFQVNSSAVFKEDVDIVPVIIDDTLSYMPWGGDNNMPFDILKLFEDDETLAKNTACRKFAVVSRIPTSDSTYYPIPYYASLFKGKWYNIKQLTHVLAGFVLRGNAVSRPRHHRPSERYRLEVGALSRTSPHDS